MTFSDTLFAVVLGLSIFRLADLAVDVLLGYIRRKKIDRIFEELDEMWAEHEALKKPVRKKAVAKKK